MSRFEGKKLNLAIKIVSPTWNIALVTHPGFETAIPHGPMVESTFQVFSEFYDGNSPPLKRFTRIYPNNFSNKIYINHLAIQ
jgi:hypothetical protein